MFTSSGLNLFLYYTEAIKIRPWREGIVMKRFVFLAVTLFLGLPVLAGVDGSSSQVVQESTSATKQSEKQDTPEEKAYKAQMIKMDDAIAKKIAEIQKKQKEIETEVYLASTPPLVAERIILETQLRELQMARDKIQTQESSRKMTEDLKNSTSRSL
ncbi:MAG TPA: hypothetical protein PLL67_02365 [Gammaproteobacteria bacterium]|nr:hypothetical protein [Gammaproteobacteria bacterium]